MSDCLFCKIIDKKIPAKIELEEKNLLVIQDVNPQAPVHLLVIPKEHVAKIDALEKNQIILAGELIDAARRVAKSKNISDYRLVFNNGALAGQSVFHIHLHLLGGRAMHWPPG